MKTVYIDTQYITLGQLLKMEDIISSGGMVKMFLDDNMVYVNDEVENRRGRKLYPNYVVTVEGYGKFQIKSH